MKIITAFLLTFLFSLAAFAQNTANLSGKITQNGNVIVADATVSLFSQVDENIKLTVATDAAGNYRFENVPLGKYTLTASASGTRGISVFGQTAVTLAAGENEQINLNLVINGGVNEIVTIAAGTAQTVDETSKSVSVLSNREIEQRSEISIVDALRVVPGLRVQQLGGFGRTANIKTRGLRNQDTAVLIDGQRFRDPTAITGDASPFLSDLTVTNVQKIEVLRGSGSSLYGTNAIGGVFNIRTDEGGGRPRFSFLGEGGGLGLLRGRANIAGGAFSDRFKYSLGASHTNLSKGVDRDDAARNTSGVARFSVALSQNTTVSARFYGADSFVQLNSNPDTIGALPATGIIDARPLSENELKRYENGTPRNQLNAGTATFIPDANDPDASQSSRFFNFHTALDGAFNQRSSYRLSYQNLTTRRRNFNGPSGVQFQPFGGNTQSDFDGNIQTFQAKTNLAARSNLLTIGYGFEREKYGNDNFPVNRAQTNTTDAAQSSNTFVIQDQLEAFSSRLQLSGAFRAQFFNLEMPRFSANSPLQNAALDNPPAAYTFDGSAAYFFRSTNTKLRAHAGNGYRVPSLYERFGTFYATFLTPNQFVLLGDPDLKPERSIAFDAGIDQTLQNNRVRLSATYFYTRLIDTIGFESIVPAIGSTSRTSGGYLNTKGGIARGGEFSAEFQPLLTTNIFASYTFTNSDQRQPQVAGSGIVETLGIPVHQFSFVVNQRIVERLNLNFDFVATSAYLAPIFSNQTFQTRIYRFEGQRRGDLTASYEIPTDNDKLRVRLFGTIENVFNQDYYENGFRTAGATGRGGLQLSF
ncbi:MAG: TonB-dependent receptor [Acidobacteriota bacterium]|nr:TonB-dependent receptor [Acidobacteriota bacterium]